jgi:hypothetical protein
VRAVGQQKHAWMLVYVPVKVEVLKQVSAVVLVIFNAVHGKILLLSILRLIRLFIALIVWMQQLAPLKVEYLMLVFVLVLRIFNAVT